MIPPLIGLRFYDHSMDNATDITPIVCDVVGWLFKEDSLSYYVAVWICNGKVNDHNTEAFQILKAAVTDRYILKSKSVDKFSFRRKREKRN